jgi:hypothetical protein
LVPKTPSQIRYKQYKNSSQHQKHNKMFASNSYLQKENDQKPFFDSNFEFNAPKFFDFTSLNTMEEDDIRHSLNASTWFDNHHPNHEKSHFLRDKENYHPSKSSIPLEKKQEGSIGLKDRSHSSTIKNTSNIIKSSILSDMSSDKNSAGTNPKENTMKKEEKPIAKSFTKEMYSHQEEYDQSAITSSIATNTSTRSIKSKSSSLPENSSCSVNSSTTSSTLVGENMRGSVRSSKSNSVSDFRIYLMKETSKDIPNIFTRKESDQRKSIETRKELQMKYISEIDELVSSFNEITQKYKNRRKQQQTRKSDTMAPAATQSNNEASESTDDNHASPLNFTKLLGRKLTETKTPKRSSIIRRIDFNFSDTL